MATEIWASGATADELARAVKAPVEAADRPGQGTAGGLVALWNAAAMGGAALAGVALIALSWFAARQRFEIIGDEVEIAGGDIGIGGGQHSNHEIRQAGGCHAGGELFSIHLNDFERSVRRL